MPFTYERDDARRRVVIAFHGPFQASDAFASIDRHRGEEGAGSYGVLYDLRGMTGHPDLSQLRQFMSANSALSDERRGPIAIVATDQEQYEKACVYAALGRSQLFTIEIFRDRNDAEVWLAAHTRPAA